MLRHSLLVLLTAAFANLPVTAADSSALTIALDGVNAVRYDYERFSKSRGVFGLSRSLLDAPSNVFERLSCHSDTTAFAGPIKLSASALAGSESGDPLLNSYQNPSLPNRDHISRLVIAASKGGAGIGGVKEYNDLYSGRFDRIRDESMPGGAHIHFGLSEEDAAAARIQTFRTLYEGSLSRYRRWHLTPLFFTPLYAEGIRSVHQGTMAIDRSRLSLFAALDMQDRFELAHTPRELCYTHFAAQGDHAITDSFALSLALERRSETTPRQQAKASGALRTKYGTLEPWAGMYENGSSFWGVTTRMAPLPFLVLEGTAEERYEAAGESFAFLHGADTVRYVPRDAAYAAGHIVADIAHAAGTVNGSARLWIDAHSALLMESWKSDGNGKILATCGLLDQTGSSGGASLRTSVECGAWSAEGAAIGHALFGQTIQPMYVPWHWQCRLRYGHTKGDSLSVSLLMEGNGPVSLTRLYSGVRETVSAPSREAVSLSLRIPFRLPRLSRQVSTVFSLDAGPFCLAPDAAANMHPYGNPIGPAITVFFAGTLTGRQAPAAVRVKPFALR